MSEILSVDFQTYLESAIVLEHEVTHCFTKYYDHYKLIIHGCKEGFVKYNDMFCTFEELAFFLRNDYNIPNDVYLHVKVYCCYGGRMSTYNDNNTLIESAYCNYDELYLNHIGDEHNHYCVFSY